MKSIIFIKYSDNKSGIHLLYNSNKKHEIKLKVIENKTLFSILFRHQNKRTFFSQNFAKSDEIQTIII